MLELYLLLLVFAFLLQHFVCELFQVIEHDELEIVEAIMEFERNFFKSNTANIRLITEESEAVSYITSKSSGNFSFEVIEPNYLENLELQTETFNLFLLSSIESFQKIEIHLERENQFDFGGYFLLALFNGCPTKAQEVFQSMWKRYIYNINIICDNGTSINLLTFLPFQDNKCSGTESTLINYFCNGSWNSNEYFPSKVDNLHSCPLKAVTFYYPPIIMRDILANGSFHYYGSEIDLLYGLAGALNFSVNLTYIPQLFSSGLLFDNGTATGILKQTIEGEMNLLTGFYYLTYQRTKYLSFSNSHYSIPLVIMIPPGEAFGSFEKLFRPFQNLVWVFLVAVFGSGFIIIAIINYQKQAIRDFFFGESIKYPCLNMINAFVGGSQEKLPQRNFARTLLMIFLLFCLVQRALYQGSLFQFLQSND